jgi:hypothetical protein
MKELRAVNPRRLAIAAVILLILSGVLFYFMRDIVREMIVYPLSYLFYVGGVLLDVTPQVFCWFSVLLLSLWIAFRSLNPKRKAEPIATTIRPESDAHAGIRGRMNFWAVKVNILEQYKGGYFMGGFHHSMGRLVIEVLAHRYRLTTMQVEERIRAGTLELPEDVQEYMRYSLGRQEIGLGRVRRVWERLLAALRERLHWQILEEKAEGPAMQAMRRLDIVIHYMEEELEVSHEYPGESSR